jgi:single-strand DNA-binding protein
MAGSGAGCGQSIEQAHQDHGPRHRHNGTPTSTTQHTDTTTEGHRTMTGLPHITAEGTLIGDPELRFTPSGVAVAKWRIACNERRFNKTTQEWENGRTTFITGSCWRGLAENVVESLKKGDLVIATGRLTMREWETDGTKQHAYEIDADTMGPALARTTARLERREHTGNTTGTTTAGRTVGDIHDPWSVTPAEEVPF